MACCKKMHGKCDMGAGQHSCCDQTVHSPDAAKAILTQTFQLQNALPLAALADGADVILPLSGHLEVSSNDGSPPESPPGSITILRI
jgi:hypothetical protein